MLIVFTGNGKGKTTAALGQAMRTLGRGKKVLVIQFIKGPWRSGEDYFAEKFQLSNSPPKMGEARPTPLGGNFQTNPKFQIKKMGLGFVGILGDKLPKEEHAKAARQALIMFKNEMQNGKWDLIILDEINVATSIGLLSKEEVIEAVKGVLPEKFVIMTGRGAPQEFIDRADLVTEMKEIKHPFNDGKMAKIAMEF